jgi:hypothetical protein
LPCIAVFPWSSILGCRRHPKKVALEWNWHVQFCGRGLLVVPGEAFLPKITRVAID